MPSALSVLTAVADPQREAVIAASIESEAELRLVRRCVDLADLLATAAAGLAQVAVVSSDLRQLDADAIQRLADLGVASVGLLADGDDDGHRRLHQLGVSQVLVDTADPAEIANVVLAAATGVGHDPALERILDWSQVAPYPASPELGPIAVSEAPRKPPTGQVIAVWGPIGSPGRTVVAVNLAAEIAELGRSTICVDADSYGGTAAQQLGVLDEAAGLAAACRLANNGGLDAASLAALAVEVRPRLRLLSGISRAERWPELRPAGVAGVLECSRSAADYVVVDCGFCLEQDEELAYDTIAPRRNGATLAALEASRLVVAIASGDPVGLARFVRARADLLDLMPELELLTVVNRVRRGVVGAGDPREEIATALSRYAGITTMTVIPDDRAALDAAMVDGRLLCEVAPGSAARKAIRDVAIQLVDEPKRRRRGVLAALRGDA